MGLKDWVTTAGDFAGGLSEGLYDFGDSTVTGLKDLAVGGYNIATDSQARANAWETTKQLGGMARDGAAFAYRNPEAAYGKARDAVTGTYAKFEAARAQAEAKGQLAQFYGKGIGRIGPELIPISKISKLGSVGKLAKGEQALDAVADASRSAKAVERAGTGLQVSKAAKASEAAAEASKVANTKPTATVPCAKAAAAHAKPPASTKAVNAQGKPTQCVGGTCTAGEPVSMVTGEELLSLTDFQIEGPVPLAWTRIYRSGQSAIDLGLGHGWLLPLSQWLDVQDTLVVYHDAEGRRMEWPLPAPGQTLRHATEDLVLKHRKDTLQISGLDQPDRLFGLGEGRQPLQGFTNESGQVIRVVRNDAGVAELLASSWGCSWIMRYESGHLLEVLPAAPGDDGVPTAIAGPLVRYQVDASGDLVASFNRLGVGERYQYRQHLLVQRTLPSGFRFSLDWDDWTPDARCLRSSGENGIHDTRFQWLPGGLSRAIDSRGGITEYVHNEHARLLSLTTPEGRCTRYSYDAGQRLKARIDGAGHTTHFEYDTDGRLLSTTDPSGSKTSLTYDMHGLPMAVTNALGHTWMQLRDPQGRTTEWRDPLGNSTRLAYNALGLPASIENPVGQKRTLLWDDQARLVGEIGFDGAKRSYKHDVEGRIVSITLQDKRQTRYTHDAAGRVVGITAPDGGVTRLTYDAAGNLTQHTDATGRSVSYQFADGLAQPTERRNGLGQSLRYEYDSERNLVALINPLGEKYRLEWDLDENLIGEIGFDGRRQRYRYGPAGHMVAWGQWDGRQWKTIQHERDPMGRLLRKLMPSGPSSTYRYDALGQLTEAANEAGTLAFEYDAAGRVLADGLQGQQARFGYDAAGRRTLTVLPDGRRLGTEWNAAGRMAATHLDDVPITRHHYDDLAQETQRQQGALNTEYAYDAAGRLTLQRASLSPGLATTVTRAAAVLERRYRYDPAGRLAELMDASQGISRYVYDPAARLARADGPQAETFAFDPAGNLVGMSLTVSSNGLSAGRIEGGRLMMCGDRHYAYDAHGNRVEERRAKGGHELRRYRYDDENRMVEAQMPSGICRFTYDALGRRIAKVSDAGVTKFTYDGATLLGEEGPKRCSVYVREDVDEHRILARIDNQGPRAADVAQVVHFHLDNTGKPCEISNAAGQVVWAARYRAYGALAATAEQDFENPFRLPGQYFDEETALHWSLFRVYDQEAGVFASNDPIGLAGGPRGQAYPDDPVNFVDPLGLACKAAKGANKAPDFVVSPNGTAFPVPKGAQGPVPVINPAGKQTGVAYTGGSGGANKKVDTIRIMDPTPPKGASPGYPSGYIKYENASGQGVNPITGKTVPNTESHFPIQ